MPLMFFMMFMPFFNRENPVAINYSMKIIGSSIYIAIPTRGKERLLCELGALT